MVYLQMRVHTGECPFHCELCNVKFKRVHHLNCHIESKIHTDMIEKTRRLGKEVPEHLDPSKRQRGRILVEDGPFAPSLHPAEDSLETTTTTTTTTMITEDGRTQIVEMDESMFNGNIVQVTTES